MRRKMVCEVTYLSEFPPLCVFVFVVDKCLDVDAHFLRLPSNNAADLQVDIDVPLVEALLGFRITFKHMDGRILSVTSPKAYVLQPGEMLRVAGEGMPIYGSQPESRGDLFIKTRLIMPSAQQLQNDPCAAYNLNRYLPKRQEKPLPPGGITCQQVFRHEAVHATPSALANNNNNNKTRKESSDMSDSKANDANGTCKNM